MVSAALAMISCIGAVLAGFLGLVGLVGWGSRRSELDGQLLAVVRTASSGNEEPHGLQVLVDWIEQSGWGKSMAARLAQADLEMQSSTYAGGLVAFWSVLFFVLWIFFQPPILIGVLLSSALTWLASHFFLENRRNHYISQLANQMPDVAILVSNSLKAGLSVMQAFQVVSEKMPRPAGVEFARLGQQMRLGIPFDEAIQIMTERLPCEELSLLLTAIGIQRKAGGNLSRALSVMSAAITARHRVRNEISTLTAEARYTGLIIIVLPVAILAILNQMMEGSVSSFLSNPIGWGIITIFIAIQVFAFISINRIANVKV